MQHYDCYSLLPQIHCHAFANTVQGCLGRSVGIGAARAVVRYRTDSGGLQKSETSRP